ncbi:MAG: hypothetical protein U0169_22690 [Polyangiaceae bacterium]
MTRTLHIYLLPALTALAAFATTGCASCRKDDDPKPVTAPLLPKTVVPIPISRAAYVTNNGSDDLSIIDRDGDTVARVSLDVDPDSAEAPHHLASSPGDGALFVALSFPAPPNPKGGAHASHGNAETHGQLLKLRLADFTLEASGPLDYNPGDVVMTHDKRHVLVTHFDMKRAMNVAAQGGSTGTMFASMQLWDAKSLVKRGGRALCVAPHGMVVSADDKTALVACYGSDELAVVDLTNPSLPTARYPLGSSPGVPGAPQYGPYFVEFVPGEKFAFVTDLEGKDCRVFDLGTKKFLPDRTVDVGARALSPAFVDENVALVPLQAPDGLVRVDVSKGTITKRTAFVGDTCPSPHVVKRAKDGRFYLVCEGDHKAKGVVVEIDPTSLAVTKRWVVGVYPDGIAFGDD